MGSSLPLSLLAHLAWATMTKAAPSDPITTPPAVLPRQNNANYIGGSQIYPYADQNTTTTVACTSNYDDKRLSICNTAFIFENTGDSNPRTNIICGDSSVNWSFYRNIPESFTQTPASRTSIPALTTTPSSSSTSPSSSPTNPPPASKNSSSKAWIAGVVVGPLIGIALVAGIILLLLRRKKKASQAPLPPQQPQQPQTFQPSNPQPPVSQYKNEFKPGFSPQMSSGHPSPGNYNPNDPYNQQAYGKQAPSPAPQYFAPYMVSGSPSPQGYSAPGSPPPPQGHSAQQLPQPQRTPTVHEQQYVPQPMAAELGGVSSPVDVAHTVELDGGAFKK
ncbi:hypothetical protein BCR34DRAFT_616973 [Clohesyomyces aquaticus]|uniref:Mid2 domain-containing protein n=1 Tax=Clohesyomyces aquaticus TaxID=1231657 RepID=A0A1Y1Z807_9PLEO|nr:hypothetical protein BCR34DRAFT_616973 [Clohesyomyces aquaticus]